MPLSMFNDVNIAPFVCPSSVRQHFVDANDCECDTQFLIPELMYVYCDEKTKQFANEAKLENVHQEIGPEILQLWICFRKQT